MAFEIFSRERHYSGNPSVTFSTSGRVAFNKAATIQLQKDKVEKVLLLWDKAKRVVGMRPVTENDARAYKVHWNRRGDGGGFSATTFLKFIEYDTSETSSLPMEWDEKEKMFLIEIPQQPVKRTK